MYLADYHVHSTCSQDGRQTMAQAAQAAVAAGMDELCLTDHVDTIYWGPEQKPRWDFDWDAVRRQFRQAQEQWGHRITLRLGAELGEAAMSFQRAEHLMQNAPPLDFVIGSVHMAGKKFHWEKAGLEEAEHAAKFAELLGEVVTDSTQKNLQMRVDAENGATAGKFELAKLAKKYNLDAIHDTVHEMARDEARHGKAFEGLLKRYFGK